MKKKLLIIFSALIIIGFGYLIIENGMQKKKNDIYEEVQEQVDNGKKVIEEEKEIEEKEEFIIPIDFHALEEINPDIYAWIDIDDTNVHYPIVQSSTDDSYYLEHTIEGAEGYPGSIYTERVNTKDFSDFNTLIYGHNMRDGSMFNHLHKFSDAEFFSSHDKITIYTEDEIKEYTIYAALIYDDRHIMNCFDFSRTDERERFIQTVKESRNLRNQFRDGIEITADSNLITLSTCTEDPSTRFIVIGVEDK